MARRSIPIEEKIEAQKEMVSKAKDKYEAELDKLEKLMKKKGRTAEQRVDGSICQQ